MASTLELKSTFQFTGESLGTIGFSAESRYFKPLNSPNSIVETKQEEPNSKKNSFSVSSEISKVIIDGLGEDLKKSTEPYCSKRLASHVNKSFDKDAYLLSLNQINSKIEGFDFNSNHSFDEHVNAKFCIKEGAHKGHMILHIPAFTPSIDLKVDDIVSNFKVFARLIAVSDFEKIGEQYEALKPNHHGGIGVFQTPMLPLLKIPTQPITTQISIEPPSFIQTGVSTVLVIGFKFYTYQDKKFHRQEEQTMMKVFKVS